MRSKIAAVGLGLFLGLSSLYAQDTVQNKPYVLVDNQPQGIYATIKALDKEELSDYFVENQNRFFDHYQGMDIEFLKRRRPETVELDQKLFDAIGNIFQIQRFLCEENMYDVNGGIFDSSEVHFNNIRLLNLYNFLQRNISNGDIEKQLKSMFYLITSDWNPTITNGKLLNINIARDKLDSFQISIIYNDMTKQLDLPVSIVRVREDFYLKYNQNKFFDPVTGENITLDDITSYYYLGNGQYNGIYLNPLNNNQILAVELARIGKFNTQQLKACFQRKLEWEENLRDDPLLERNNPEGVRKNNQIFASEIELLRKNAESYFDAALALDPDCIDAYMSRGCMYNQVGTNYSEKIENDSDVEAMRYWDLNLINLAIENFQKLMSYDSADPTVYYNLSTALMNKVYGSMVQDIPVTDQLYQKADSYLQRAQELEKIENKLRGGRERVVPEKPQLKPNQLFPPMQKV